MLGNCGDRLRTSQTARTMSHLQEYCDGTRGAKSSAARMNLQ